MRFMPAGHLLSLLRQSVNLHSLSARQLLRPKNMATALQMLARYPTLLRFAPCIHAFMPQNLFTRIMNTGSKQKKGDPDVQVWLRQTSRRLHPFFGACELVALRAPSDNARLFPKKGCCVRLDVEEGSSIKHLRWIRQPAERSGVAKLKSIYPAKTAWQNIKRFCFFRLPLGLIAKVGLRWGAGACPCSW